SYATGRVAEYNLSCWGRKRLREIGQRRVELGYIGQTAREWFFGGGIEPWIRLFMASSVFRCLLSWACCFRLPFRRRRYLRRSRRLGMNNFCCRFMRRATRFIPAKVTRVRLAGR